MRGPLEEEEGRALLERRILGDQLLIAALERRQMIDFVFGEPLEDAAGAVVAGQRLGAGVELAAAALGGDGDAQRVAGEHALGRFAVHVRAMRACTAVFAPAEDLDDGLGWFEMTLRRHLVDQQLDVGAQELGRAVAIVTDEVIVTRMLGCPFET